MIRPLDTLTAVVLAANLRERDAREVLTTSWHDDIVRWAASAANVPGEQWVLSGADGRPVAMFGFEAQWPGVLHTWLAATHELPRHAIELLRFAKERHAMHARAGVRRFHCMCEAGYETGLRFLARLGYQIEGLARRYGKGGEDYHYLSRLEA